MSASQIPKLLFIGAGNIAQSIMRGIVRARPESGRRMMAVEPKMHHLSLIKKTIGCHISLLENANEQVAEFQPDLVLMCIKPQVLLASIQNSDQLSKLLRFIAQRCVILSLLAGVDSHVYQNFSIRRENIVRIMLNTAAEINATSIFIHAHHDIPAQKLDTIKDLMRLLGQPIVELNNESLMDVATGFCGSGLAFYYEMIQSVSDVAVKNGIPRHEATQIAAQMAKSAGEMVLHKDEHPYVLRDQVSSPAGTTINGIFEWHKNSTSQSIAASVQASIDKSKELSKNSFGL